MRKTIKIDELRKMINGRVLSSRDGANEERVALINLLSKILHDTGNYQGFMYLDSHDMKNSLGRSVGINTEDGLPLEDYVARFENTDSTRVKYI